LRVVAGVLAFALVAAVWHFGGRQSGDIAPVNLRRDMPAIVMEQMGGGTWEMDEHRGEVVLINYWATWCGPCREEVPGLIHLQQELGPKGLTVVGVSLDEGRKDKVREFVEQYRVTYPVTFPDALSQMGQGLEGVPTTILVDRKMRVAKIYVGAVQERDFREDVMTLLGEKK
jgi:cytochrome c biogenesis protein CcmG, thiol:disulfide interchange protein DsbE